jgi:Rod binding domain-containing protein
MAANSYYFFTTADYLVPTLQEEKPVISSLNPNSHTTPPQMQKLTQQLESTFWAQMLKSSQAYQASESSFGMDQFQSYLIDIQAKMLSQTQSLGLAQAIQNSLEGGQDNG